MIHILLKEGSGIRPGTVPTCQSEPVQDGEQAAHARDKPSDLRDGLGQRRQRYREQRGRRRIQERQPISRRRVEVTAVNHQIPREPVHI
jgi:hypothetical protein